MLGRTIVAVVGWAASLSGTAYGVARWLAWLVPPLVHRRRRGTGAGRRDIAAREPTTTMPSLATMRARWSTHRHGSERRPSAVSARRETCPDPSPFSASGGAVSLPASRRGAGQAPERLV